MTARSTDIRGRSVPSGQSLEITIRPRFLASTRRGGSVWVSAGFVSTAASAAVLLGGGARLLTPSALSGLAWVWTLATVFGFGVASPGEQAINQRLNSGQRKSVLKPVVAVVISAVAVGSALIALGDRLMVTSEYPQLITGGVLAVTGWAFAAIVRGRLAGRGDLVAYGSVLMVEALIRCSLVAVAAESAAGPSVLGLAVGVPYIAAGTAGLLFRSERADVDKAKITTSVSAPANSTYASFVMSAISYQACINGPPLLLGWHGPNLLPGALGMFAIANAWLRSPTIATGGYSVHALTILSARWSEGDRKMFFTESRRAAARATLVGVVLSVGCVALSPIALALLSGRTSHVPMHLVVALGASTVFAIAAVMINTALLSRGLGNLAVIAWGLGALVTVGGVWISGGASQLLAASVVSGPLVAFLIGLVALRTRTRGVPNDTGQAIA